MTYPAGAYSAAEAARIAFLVQRDPDAAPREAVQILSVYLTTIESNPRHFAYQRSARGEFAAAVQELAAFLGDDLARPVLEKVAGKPVPSVPGYLTTLATLPADRQAPPDRVQLQVRGTPAPELLAALQALAQAHGADLRL